MPELVHVSRRGYEIVIPFVERQAYAKLGLSGRCLIMFADNCLEDILLRVDGYIKYKKDPSIPRYTPVPVALQDDPKMQCAKFIMSSCTHVMSNSKETLRAFASFWKSANASIPVPPLVYVRVVHGGAIEDVGPVMELQAEIIHVDIIRCSWTEEETKMVRASIDEAYKLSSLGTVRPGEHEALVVYTSGTTNMPKGACISYINLMYSSALLAWQMNAMEDRLPLCFSIANPLYHVNATTFLFMAIASPDEYKIEKCYIYEKYNRDYFGFVTSKITNSNRLVVPLVPKHIHFLKSEGPEVGAAIGNAYGKTLFFLLGSSQVDQGTFVAASTITQGLSPYVRYGSTETTLQIMGTPFDLDPKIIRDAYTFGYESMSCLIGIQPDYLEIHSFLDPWNCDTLKPYKPYRWRIKRDANDKSSSGMMWVSGGQIITEYTNASIHHSLSTKDNVNWFKGLGDFCISRMISGHMCVYWISRSAGLFKRNGVLFSTNYIEEVYRNALLFSKIQKLDLALVNIPFVEEYRTILPRHMESEAVLVLLHTLTEVNIEDILHGKKNEVANVPLPDIYIPVFNIPRNFKGALNSTEAINIVNKYVQRCSPVVRM